MSGVQQPVLIYDRIAANRRKLVALCGEPLATRWAGIDHGVEIQLRQCFAYQPALSAVFAVVQDQQFFSRPGGPVAPGTAP